MRKFKVMVITTNWWAKAGQIAIALAKTGFQVALQSPPASVVRKVKAVDAHYTYMPWAGSSSIAKAIKKFSPNFLVCADDEAVLDLHKIYEQASKYSNNSHARYLVELIEVSLGSPSSFKFTAAKSEFMTFAQSIGVRCPKTITIADEAMLRRELVDVTYPVVIKADRSCGGIGVRVAKNELQAQKAYSELALAFTWPSAFMEVIRGLTPRPLLDRLLRRRRTVTLQEYVAGHSTNRAVVCLRGKTLTGISVEAIQTVRANGPASVVRVIDHPEMTKTIEILVERLSLAGYCGFDFVIDSSNRAWLVEMNPRVTPICSLPIKNNLSAALFAALTKTRSMKKIPCTKEKLIALFPQKWKQSSERDHPSLCFPDVPREEPEFIRACLIPGSEDGFTGSIARHFLGVYPFQRKLRVPSIDQAMYPHRSVSTLMSRKIEMPIRKAERMVSKVRQIAS